jgi:putative tryptophan/tyrosine transport system substrate-binding protein
VISRRGFIGAVAGGLAVAPAASAQPAKKVARIGYLTGGSIELEKNWIASLQQGLRELGYVEGENVVLELQGAAGRADRLSGLAQGLIRSKVDVLVTAGDAATLAAKEATTTVPVVMVTVADPVGIGLVASLGRPGGNVTGLADLHGDLVGKPLEILQDLVPSASGAFAAIKRERFAGLIVLGDRMFGAIRKRIVELALVNRLPTVYTHRWWVENGGLVSYGANFNDLYRRVATYVDKILKGAKPGDLPVEQPTRLELVINLKTARSTGLTVPPALLARADEVIQG